LVPLINTVINNRELSFMLGFLSEAIKFILVVIALIVIVEVWISAKQKEKEKIEEWESYLANLTEKQCFAIASDKSGTKFEDDQRGQAYKRGCELRRIRELGE